MGGRAGGQARAGRRPHRVGQDPRRVPVGARPAGRRAAARRSRSTAAGSSTSRRSRRWRSTCSATCARRWPASGRPRSALGPAGPRHHGRACAPATPRPTSAGCSPAPRPTCWSPRPSRCSCCSPRRRGSRCAGSRTVILDEVHAVAGTKRGAHLALSLERLDELLERARPSGSGCRPPSGRSTRSSTFLAGARPVEVVQPPHPEDDRGDRRGAGARSRRARRAAGARQLRRGGHRLGRGHRAAAVDLARGGAAAAGAGARAPVDDRVRQLPAAGRAAHVAAQRAGRRGGARPTRRSSTSTRSRPRRSGSPASAAARPPTVAKAHHGSMSREQRTLVEEELKGGRAALRRGHVQPGAGHRHGRGRPRRAGGGAAERRVRAAAGRPGRATRSGAVSRGVVFPKYRGDLVSCAVVAERMAAGAIESMRYPRNPLDVLAQQIVAMVALEPWTLADLAAVVRRAAPFAALPDSALHAVLDMLAGRYPSEEFGELRARITWDRVTDELRGPPGRAAAGRHLRRHDPRPRPVHGDDPGRRRRRGLAGRRAGRGDGLRVAGRRHVPARHVELAGARTSRTTA